MYFDRWIGRQRMKSLYLLTPEADCKDAGIKVSAGLIEEAVDSSSSCVSFFAVKKCAMPLGQKQSDLPVDQQN